MAAITAAAAPVDEILLADMLDMFALPYWNKSHTDRDKAVIAATFMEAMAHLPAFAVWNACKDWNSHKNPKCEWLPKAGSLAAMGVDILYSAVNPTRVLINRWDLEQRIAAPKTPAKVDSLTTAERIETSNQILKDGGFGHLVKDIVKKTTPVKITLTETEALGAAEHALSKLKFAPTLIVAITDEMRKTIYKMKTPPSGMKKVGTAVKTAVKQESQSK